MPASLGEMDLHTPMLPCRMACPAASSRKKRGMPTTNISTTYSKRKAPEEQKRTCSQGHSSGISRTLDSCNMKEHSLMIIGQHYYCISHFSSQTLGYFLLGPEFGNISPPPFWWHKYGNRHTLPSPTLNPTWARKYSNLLFHPARVASDEPSWFSSTASPSSSDSAVWLTSLGKGCFSI